MNQLNAKGSKICCDDIVFGFVALTFFFLPTGTAPPLIGIGLASVIWLFSVRISAIGRIIKQSWFAPVIFFILLPWIGLLYSKDIQLGFHYALKTKYWLVVFMSAGLVLNKDRINFLIMSFLAGLLSGVLLAMMQCIGIVRIFKEHFLGYGIVHTLLSMYLVIGILIVSFYFRKAKNQYQKLGIILVILAYIFHLAMLYGRSGYIVFVLITPLVACNIAFNGSRKKKVAVCLALILFFVSFPNVRHRIAWTNTQIKNQSALIKQGQEGTELPRFFIISRSIKLFLGHPLIGIGTGSLKYYTEKEIRVVSHPHNNILYMGVSFGIFGVFVCVWLFWNMFKISWRVKRTPLGFFIFSVCIVIFLGGIFDTQILNTGTLLMLTMTYGLLNHIVDLPQTDT